MRILSSTILTAAVVGMLLPGITWADFERDGMTPIVSYRIDDGELDSKRTPRLGDDTVLERYQDAVHEHQQIWDTITTLYPPAMVDRISKLSLETDGFEDRLAAVEIDVDDVDRWIITIDPLDVFDEDGSTIDSAEFLATLVHELGHIVTLGTDQVDVITTLRSTDPRATFEDLLAIEARKCRTYFTGDGCSERDSYINAYVQEFWEGDLLSAYEDQFGDNVGSFDIEPEDFENFYDQQPEQFITSYAASHPLEDLAESFTGWVLRPTATDRSSMIVTRKLQFFTRYPELVTLRDELRQNLNQLDATLIALDNRAALIAELEAQLQALLTLYLELLQQQLARQLN